MPTCIGIYSDICNKFKVMLVPATEAIVLIRWIVVCIHLVNHTQIPGKPGIIVFMLFQSWVTVEGINSASLLFLQLTYIIQRG